MDKSNYTIKTKKAPPPFKPQIHIAMPQGHRFFQDCLRESYARWIDWGVKVLPGESVWFVTQTFKREVFQSKALKLSHTWLYRLMQSYEHYKPGSRIRWIRAMAMQKRGVVHFHLLVCGKDLNLLSRKSWECRWETMDWNNGTCRIYDSDNKKTSGYLAKELSKEGDLSWGGSWQGLHTPGAVGCCGNINRGMIHGRTFNMARRS